MRVHDGSDGWRVAQEREVMSGWAWDVSGEMGERDGGRVDLLVGNSVGEM